MAQVGCLGDIVFTVSSNKVLTPNKIQWSGASRYTEHQRHLGNALTEFTGISADKMAFEITLASELGVNVMEELGKIWLYERTGKTLPLVIGTTGYGKYRWTIVNHKSSFKHFDKWGNVSVATVSLNLLEYLKL